MTFFARSLRLIKVDFPSFVVLLITVLIVGSFEQMARSLGDHLGELQKIVLNTIEHGRNLPGLAGAEGGDEMEQWSLSQYKRLDDDYNSPDHADLLERELMQCMQVASLDEIAALHACL